MTDRFHPITPEVRKNARPGAGLFSRQCPLPPRGLPNPHPVSTSIDVTRPKDARPGGGPSAVADLTMARPQLIISWPWKTSRPSRKKSAPSG